MEDLAANLGDTFFGSQGHFLSKKEGIGRLVSMGLSYAFVVAGVVLVIMIIYSGIQMISAAGGDQRMFERARSVLTSGVVGFVLVIASWFIVKAVEFVTGVRILWN